MKDKRNPTLSAAQTSKAHPGLRDLIDIEDLQKIQDAFSMATGVGSIITETDGTPITRPSNFCRLCSEIIRKTEKGLLNCIHSDSVIGRFHPEGPVAQKCLSSGLWDAGASITVGEHHIANWLIGQVRNEKTDLEALRKYAQTIGADENEFLRAFDEVTEMTLEQFQQVAQALFLLANQISQLAFQKLMLERTVKAQKRTEKALLKSEQRFRRIYDNIVDVYYEATLDGKLLEVSPSVERVLSYRKSDLIGKCLTDFYVDPDDRNQFVRLMREKGTVKNYEIRIRDKAGRPRICSMNAALTSAPDAPSGKYAGTFRDITDKKQVEEMMLQNEKMLSVGGLAAGMAHEINNPLAGMIQTANLMANRLSKDTGIEANQEAANAAGTTIEAVQAYMEKRGIFRMIRTIRDSGNRIGQIVGNMLDFARKADAAPSTHDPVELLEKILALAATDYDLKKRFDFKSIEIEREYEPNLPQLPCQKVKIQQVLLNVLRNGAQAMSRAERQPDSPPPKFILRLSHEKEENCLRIEIQDNGPGMDEAVRKRVFEPFFTTKPAGSGTGLGLSVSYFIVTETHGGEISVDSAPGKGATFFIRLPLAPPRKPA